MSHREWFETNGQAQSYANGVDDRYHCIIDAEGEIWFVDVYLDEDDGTSANGLVEPYDLAYERRYEEAYEGSR